MANFKRKKQGKKMVIDRSGYDFSVIKNSNDSEKHIIGRDRKQLDSMKEQLKNVEFQKEEDS